MIIQIGTEADESRILWKRKETDEWSRADIDDLILAFESAQNAEPKTGKWAEIENGEYLCSNCLHITIGYPPSNCPNCGSFNGGEEE